jgi:single-strand selective monofunctional uracil DNA glycosylase
MSTASALIAAADELRTACNALSFADPISHVYNPLDYAWDVHCSYLKRYGEGHKRIVMLGMNPGPFGMAQCGVPFGEIDHVRDWMGLEGPIGKPAHEHPKRPIDGFACTRSEVSGRRLWGAFAERFGTADTFFDDHFVVNFCPLVFMQDSGRNHTPDKLPAAEKDALFVACDQHLRAVITALEPAWLLGVGRFARDRCEAVVAADPSLAPEIQIGQILHPSPASPAANRGWAEAATKQMVTLGLWS